MLPKRAVVCMMWMGFCGGEVLSTPNGSSKCTNIDYLAIQIASVGTFNRNADGSCSVGGIKLNEACLDELIKKLDESEFRNSNTFKHCMVKTLLMWVNLKQVKKKIPRLAGETEVDYIKWIATQLDTLIDIFNPISDPLLYLMPHYHDPKWQAWVQFFISTLDKDKLVQFITTYVLTQYIMNLTNQRYIDSLKDCINKINAQSTPQNLANCLFTKLLPDDSTRLMEKATALVFPYDPDILTMVKWLAENIPEVRDINTRYKTDLSKAQCSKECKYAIASYFTSVQMKNYIHLLRTEMNLTPKKSFT